MSKICSPHMQDDYNFSIAEHIDDFCDKLLEYNDFEIDYYKGNNNKIEFVVGIIKSIDVICTLIETYIYFDKRKLLMKSICESVDTTKVKFILLEIFDIRAYQKKMSPKIRRF